MRRIIFCLFIGLLCLLGTGGLLAQSTTGSILGQVTDPASAAIPSAKVTVTNVLTGEIHETTTNEIGSYVVPHLPVGSYKVESQANGFKHTVREGITLAVNQQARVDLVLALWERPMSRSRSTLIRHKSTPTAQNSANWSIRKRSSTCP